MRFGKPQNNRLFKVFKFVLTVFIFCNCAALAGCQTKEEKTATALEKCQKSLDKDEVFAAFKCYAETAAAHPEADDLITRTIEETVFKKCLEYRDKDVKNALLCFEGVAGISPRKANAHFLLADSFLQYAGREREQTGYQVDFETLNRAEEAIKKGLRIAPEDAAAHSVYGEILKEKGDWKKALDEYKEAVRLAPKEAVFWIKLAMIQEKLDYNDIAVSSFQQALKLNSNDSTALYFLGKLYEKTGKLDEAIETIERRVKLEPVGEDALQKLKELIELREQRQNPKKSKSESIQTGPNSGSTTKDKPQM